MPRGGSGTESPLKCTNSDDATRGTGNATRREPSSDLCLLRSPAGPSRVSSPAMINPKFVLRQLPKDPGLAAVAAWGLDVNALVLPPTKGRLSSCSRSSCSPNLPGSSDSRFASLCMRSRGQNMKRETT